MHKVGARVWLSRIMVSWGIVSIAMMFIRDTTSFYILRFLLGLTEAGFSPGVVLYLTYWFPNRFRSQAYGWYYLGVPIALMLGGPFTGWLLDMTPVMGLKNWQWMFLVQGVLTVAVGVYLVAAACHHQIGRQKPQLASNGDGDVGLCGCGHRFGNANALGGDVCDGDYLGDYWFHHSTTLVLEPAYPVFARSFCRCGHGFDWCFGQFGRICGTQLKKLGRTNLSKQLRRLVGVVFGRCGGFDFVGHFAA